MKKFFKNILLFFDNNLFRWLVRLAYPLYQRPRNGYEYHYKVLSKYFFAQKILRINGSVKWPVHYTSKVLGAEFIKKGVCCDPGDNLGNYINAYGGLILGNNVNIGPNTVIATTNHYKYDDRKLSKTKGIEIGDNVWIGANCTITAGSKIGSNVTIGAGCVISGVVGDNMQVIQDVKNLLFTPKTKAYEWDSTKEVLT